jgi:cytoskeletal protein CcmA (bactofilin family)
MRGGIRVFRSAAPFIFAIAALAPLGVAAADVRQGPSVGVGAGESIQDDIYAFGGTIDIGGTINGSVIAAGGTITISGPIQRDVIVSGGNVTITGRVGGSIRAAAGTLTLSAPVGEDLVVAGGTVSVGPSATIGRDLLLGAGTTTVDAPVKRNVLASVGDLTIRNTVGGKVTARVNHLRLESGASIAGNLDYTSNNQVAMAAGAHVEGTTTRHTPTDSGAGGAANGFVGWLRALVGIFILGLLLLLLFPGFSGRVRARLETSPWASLGIGAAILVGVPIAAIIVFIAGIFVGGWWLALALVVAYLLALALGYVVSGYLIGRFGFDLLGWRGLHPALELLGGLVVLSIVTLIPILGGLVVLAACLFGLGALTLTTLQARATARPA